MIRRLPVANVSLVAVAAVGVLAWHAALTGPARLTVTFLDVGQGDAVFIRTPTGRSLLIDTGRTGETDDQGRRVVLPFLRSQGVRSLDALVLTHADDDHAGGAATVLRRMPVRRLVVSGLESDASAYQRALREARSRRCRVVAVRRGQSMQTPDGVTLEVLHPPPGLRPADNDGSLVLRLLYGRTAVLLTGDAGAAAEGELLRTGADVRADVLKLGHHGSVGSTSDALVDAVRPRAAVVSAGQRNPFGHPHPGVLARLSARGIPVFRTDRHGAVTLRSDGRVFRVTTMRDRARR